PVLSKTLRSARLMGTTASVITGAPRISVGGSALTKASALVQRKNPRDLVDVAHQHVEHDLLGAMEAEIGRLAHRVFDPRLCPFPQEVPDRPRAEAQLQHVVA